MHDTSAQSLHANGGFALLLQAVIINQMHGMHAWLCVPCRGTNSQRTCFCEILTFEAQSNAAVSTDRCTNVCRLQNMMRRFERLQRVTAVNCYPMEWDYADPGVCL